MTLSFYYNNFFYYTFSVSYIAAYIDDKEPNYNFYYNEVSKILYWKEPFFSSNTRAVVPLVDSNDKD